MNPFFETFLSLPPTKIQTTKATVSGSDVVKFKIHMDHQSRWYNLDLEIVLEALKEKRLIRDYPEDLDVVFDEYTSFKEGEWVNVHTESNSRDFIEDNPEVLKWALIWYLEKREIKHTTKENSPELISNIKKARA